MMTKLVGKTAAGFLAALYFVSNVALSHALETNVWAERRRSAVQLASLPALPAASRLIRFSAGAAPQIPAASSLRAPRGVKVAPVDPRLPLLPAGVLLRETFLSSRRDAPLVVLFQDIHQNFEAQTHIARALLELRRLEPATLIGVEGAFGPMDFSRFRGFGDARINEIVATDLLRRNRIAAPSYAGLVAAPQAALLMTGVDDEALYLANVEAYRDALPGRSAVRRKLARWTAGLAERKKTGFNAALSEFDAIDASLFSAASGLADSIQGLLRLGAAAGVEPKLSPTGPVSRFLEACGVERSLDFPRVERERAVVIQALAGRLSHPEMQDLLARSVAYRGGDIGYADYYGAIEDLMRRHDVDPSRTPEFQRYLRYVALADGIRADALLKETARLRGRVLDALVKTDEERRLFEEAHLARLSEKLIDFALTPDEWEEYRSLKSLSPLSLEDFEDFYRLADERSGRMVENLLARARSDAPRAARIAVVSGGFHTPEMTAELRRRGVSYAVVQPAITKLADGTGTEYLSMFTREKTSIEKMFEGKKLFLATSETALGAGTVKTRPVTALALIFLEIGYRMAQAAIGPAARLAIVSHPDGRVQLTDEVSGDELNYTTAPGDIAGFSEAGSEPTPFGVTVRHLRPKFSLLASAASLLRGAAAWVAGVWNDYASRRPEEMTLTQRGVISPLVEIGFPALSLILLYVMPVFPGASALFFLINAIIFAARHDNTVDDRFSWSMYVGRVVGGFVVLAGSGGAMSAFGVSGVALVANPGALMAFLSLTAVGHGLWNAFIRADWRLTMKGSKRAAPRDPYGLDARIREIVASPAFRDAMEWNDGDRLEEHEAAAIRRYLMAANGRAFPFHAIPGPIVSALQAYEIADVAVRVKESLNAHAELHGEAANREIQVRIVRREAEILQKRLAVLGSLSGAVNLRDRPALDPESEAAAALGADGVLDARPHVWQLRPMRIEGVAFRMWLLISPREQDAEVVRKAIADTLAAIDRDDLDEAVSRYSLLPDGREKRAVLARLERGLVGRLNDLDTLDELRDFVGVMPADLTRLLEPVINERRADLALEFVSLADSTEDVPSDLMTYFPDGDPRRVEAEKYLKGLAAIERVMAARKGEELPADVVIDLEAYPDKEKTAPARRRLLEGAMERSLRKIRSGDLPAMIEGFAELEKNTVVPPVVLNNTRRMVETTAVQAILDGETLAEVDARLASFPDWLRTKTQAIAGHHRSELAWRLVASAQTAADIAPLIDYIDDSTAEGVDRRRRAENRRAALSVIEGTDALRRLPGSPARKLERLKKVLQKLMVEAAAAATSRPARDAALEILRLVRILGWVQVHRLDAALGVDPRALTEWTRRAASSVSKFLKEIESMTDAAELESAAAHIRRLSGAAQAAGVASAVHLVAANVDRVLSAMEDRRIASRRKTLGAAVRALSRLVAGSARNSTVARLRQIGDALETAAADEMIRMIDETLVICRRFRASRPDLESAYPSIHVGLEAVEQAATLLRIASPAPPEPQEADATAPEFDPARPVTPEERLDAALADVIAVLRNLGAKGAEFAQRLITKRNDILDHPETAVETVRSYRRQIRAALANPRNAGSDSQEILMRIDQALADYLEAKEPAPAAPAVSAPVKKVRTPRGPPSPATSALPGTPPAPPTAPAADSDVSVRAGELIAAKTRDAAAVDSTPFYQTARFWSRVAVFAAVVFVTFLIYWYAPGLVKTVLDVGSLGLYSSPMPDPIGGAVHHHAAFMLAAAPVTYLGLRFIAIIVEAAYRISYPIVRWVRGESGGIAYDVEVNRKLPDGRLIESERRTDGVEVDFMSDEKEILAALTNRFFTIHRDDGKVDVLDVSDRLNGLSRGDLLRLYYALDAQDARLKAEKDRQAQAAEHEKGPKLFENPVYWILHTLAPWNLIPHLYTFLRDYFFRTDLDQNWYRTTGRFINHFDSLDQAKAIIDATLEEVHSTRREEPTGRLAFMWSILYGMWDRTSEFSAWYWRNNIFLAGLLGYLYRRIRITIFGALAGLFLYPIFTTWFVAAVFLVVLIYGLRNGHRGAIGWGAVGLVFFAAMPWVLPWFVPWLLNLSADEWVRTSVLPKIPEQGAQEFFRGSVFESGVGQTIYRYLSVMAAHLSFSVGSLVTTFFTAFGLGFHSQVMNTYRAMAGKVANPFAEDGAKTDFESVRRRIALIHEAPRAPGTSDADYVAELLRRLEAISEVDALLDADRTQLRWWQFYLPSWWTFRWTAAPDYSDIEGITLRWRANAARTNLLFALQQFEGTPLVQAGVADRYDVQARQRTDRLLEKIAAHSLASGGFWSVVGGELSKSSFWERQVISMGGMWTLGAEIHAVVELSADAGWLLSGGSASGEWFGRTAANVLEGDHGSAMSLMGDLQRFTLNQFGFHPVVAREPVMEPLDGRPIPDVETAPPAAPARPPVLPAAGGSGAGPDRDLMPDWSPWAAARVGTLQRWMDEAARDHLARGGAPVELPEIPVDAYGNALLLTDGRGQPLTGGAVAPDALHVRFTDGTVARLRDMRYDAASRSYSPPDGKRFMPMAPKADVALPARYDRGANVRLAFFGEFYDEARGGVVRFPMRDRNGRLIEGNGFRVVPGMTSSNARWRDMNGRVTNEYPVGRAARPVNPATGFDVMLGPPQRVSADALARSEMDLQILNNRIALLDAQRTATDVAFRVRRVSGDARDYTILERYRTHDAVPQNVVYWQVQPDGTFREIDPRLFADARIDRMTIRGTNDEVLFTLAGERASRVDAENLRKTETEILRSWATGAQPRNLQDLGAWHESLYTNVFRTSANNWLRFERNREWRVNSTPTPVFAFARVQSGGPGQYSYILLPTRDFAVGYAQSVGVRDGRVIERLAGGQSVEGDLGDGVRIISNESPGFREAWMRWYIQNGYRDAEAVRIGPDMRTRISLGEGGYGLGAADIARVQPTPAQIRANGFVHVVSGREVERVALAGGRANTLATRGVVQLAPAGDQANGDWIIRAAYGEGVVYERVTHAQYQTLTEGRVRQVSTGEGAGRSTLLGLSLAYRVTPSGEVRRIYSDPIELDTVLRRPNLIYELSNGTRLRAHELPTNPTSGHEVISIIDPETNDRIMVGSEWNRINYLLNQMVRLENQIRGGPLVVGSRNDAVRAPLLTLEGVPPARLALAASIVPAQYAEYEAARQVYLAMFRANIDAEPNAVERNRMISDYRDAVNARSFNVRHLSVGQIQTLRGQFSFLQPSMTTVVIRGTPLERIDASQQELLRLTRSLASEQMRRENGGRITQPGGRALREIADLEEERRQAYLDLRTARGDERTQLRNEIARLNREIGAKSSALRASLRDWARNLRREGGRAFPAGLDPFTDREGRYDRAAYLEARRQQTVYMDGLRRQLAGAGPGERDAIIGRMDAALKADSFMDGEGERANEVFIITPLVEARTRADESAARAENDRELLRIRLELMRGTPGAVVTTVTRLPDGRERVSYRWATQTERSEALNRAIEAARGDAGRRADLEAIRTEGEGSRRGFAVALPNNAREVWSPPLRDGGALTLIAAPNRAAGDSVARGFETLGAGLDARDRFLDWARERDIPRAMERARTQGLFAYPHTDGRGRPTGLSAEWEIVYGLNEARRSVDEARNAAALARARESGAAMIVYQIESDGRATIVTDPAQAQIHENRVAEIRGEALRRYQDLAGRRDPAAVEERTRVLARLRDAERNIYETGEGAGRRRFVIEYSYAAARAYEGRLYRSWAASQDRTGSERSHIIIDNNGVTVGTLRRTVHRVDGRDVVSEVITEPRVIDYRNGLTLIELRTFAAGGPGERPREIEVTREWVDSRRRVVARVKGDTDARGRFTGRFITINQFDPRDPEAIDAASSVTYRFERDTTTFDQYRAEGVRLSSARIVSRDGARGIVEYEIINSRGLIWREVKDARGRLLLIREGPRLPDGRFQRIVRFHYDDPAFGALNIATRSEVMDVTDPRAPRRIGRSNVQSTFSEFCAAREITYERVNELTGEVALEVKDLNGLLVRRFAMRMITDALGTRLVPYNVTFFRYDGRHAHLELADAAYTFVTDERGQVELVDAGGRREFVPPTHAGLNATPSAYSYFAHTEIVEVDMTTHRIHYRVNVKDAAGERDVERYREIKNAEGDLIQRQVGHRSGATFRAEEVTINSEFWNGIARRSNSYTIRYHGSPNGNAITFTDLPPGVNMETRTDNSDPAHPVTYTQVRKESSEFAELTGGALVFDRVVFAFLDRPSGVAVVVRSRLRDVVRDGLLAESRDLSTGLVTYYRHDNRRTVVGARVYDEGRHPSVSRPPAREPQGILRQTVTRERTGTRINPYFPDQPPQYWQEFNYAEMMGPIRVADGVRWSNVEGRSTVVTRGTGSAEQPETSYALTVNDRDPISSRVTRVAPAGEFSVRLAALPGEGPRQITDVRGADFLYFTAERDGRPGALELAATFRDATGRAVTLSTSEEPGTQPFWVANSDNALAIRRGGRLAQRVSLIEESTVANRRFVFAVPVAQLREAGLDPARLHGEVRVRVTSGGEAVDVRHSEIHRAGRPAAARSADDQPVLDNSVLTHVRRDVLPTSGQSVFFNGDVETLEGAGVVIRAPDNRILGVMRAYNAGSERSGRPFEQRRLILYDQSGTFPVASVGLRESSPGARDWSVDRSDVIPYAIEIDGNRVTVYEEDPSTTPRYPVRSVYRLDALDPSRPAEGGRRVGQLVNLPNPTDRDLGSRAENRLHNTPYNILLRYLRGESFDDMAPQTRVTDADINEALAALGEDAVLTAHRRLDDRQAALPEASRAMPERVTPPFSWWRLVSIEGGLFVFLALLPLWLFFWAVRGQSLWDAWRDRIKERRKENKARGRGPLYDDDDIEEALTRFNIEVLGTRAYDAFGNEIPNRDGMGRLILRGGKKPVLVTSDGDIEGAFLNNLFLIYVTTYAWNKRMRPEFDGVEDLMPRMDNFAKALCRFVSEEIGRGSEGVRYVGDDGRPLPGPLDPQIISKVEIYLSQFRDQIKGAWLNERKERPEEGEEETPPSRVAPAFEGMVRAVTIPDATRPSGLRFDQKALNAFIDDQKLYRVRPAYQTVGRYVVKSAIILLGVLVFGAGPIEFTSSAVLGTFVSFLVIGAVSLVINAITEQSVIERARIMPSFAARLRAIPTAFTAIGFLMVFLLAGPHFATAITAVTLALFFALETFGLLVGRRSIAGVAWTYHTRLPYSVGRPRAILLTSLTWTAFIAIGVFIGAWVIPWFVGKYFAGSLVALTIAMVIFILRLPLLHHGVNLMVRFFFSWLAPSFGSGPKVILTEFATQYALRVTQFLDYSGTEANAVKHKKTIEKFVRDYVHKDPRLERADWPLGASGRDRLKESLEKGFLALFRAQTSEGGIDAYKPESDEEKALIQHMKVLALYLMKEADAPNMAKGHPADKDQKQAIVHIGGQSMMNQIIANPSLLKIDPTKNPSKTPAEQAKAAGEKLADQVLKAMAKDGPDVAAAFRRRLIAAGLTAREIDAADKTALRNRLAGWLAALYLAEMSANGGKGVTMFSPAQMDPRTPAARRIDVPAGDRSAVECAFHLRRLTVIYPAVQQHVKEFQRLIGIAGASRDALMHYLNAAAADGRLAVSEDDIKDPARVRSIVWGWFETIYTAEFDADNGEGTTLWSLRQVTDRKTPAPLKVGQDLDTASKAAIEYAFKLRLLNVELSGLGGSSLNTASNFVDWAEGFGAAGIAENMVFFIGHNKYEKHDQDGDSPMKIARHNRTEIGQRMKLAALLEYVSSRDGKPGVNAYVAYNRTVFALKSGAMNMIFMVPAEMPKIRSMIITDRNATMREIGNLEDTELGRTREGRGILKEAQRMMSNSNMAVIVAFRNTTYILDPLGKTSFAIEGGHGVAMQSLPDKIGTGWANFMRVAFHQVLKEFAEPDAPFINYAVEDPDEDAHDAMMRRRFGIIGFAPNAVGISEDYWAVLQQFHNLVGLGQSPEVALTEAIGHKVREKQHYAEWLPAPPRWSSGLIQTMEDLLNQQANEFGPESFFEKEARQTNMDHYLLGPIILFDILLMAVAIIMDWSPFVGIALLFWIPGMFFNQASTGNSWLANIRHMGVLPGTARWIEDRVSDALLFAPRTVRDSLAQIAGYQGPSFEFKISGAGAEANPWKVIFDVAEIPLAERNERGEMVEVKRNVMLLNVEVVSPKVRRYFIMEWTGLVPHTRVIEIDEAAVARMPAAEKALMEGMSNAFKKMSSIAEDLSFSKPYSFLWTFIFGIVLLGVNLYALQFLSATNALMMLFSLWFSVGVAFGPMLKAAKKGDEVWGGAGDLIAKIFGMVMGLVTLTALTAVVNAFAGGSAILLAGAALGASLLIMWGTVNVQERLEKSGARGALRLSSEAHRGFWMWMALFGWFAIVPMHPYMRLDWIAGAPIMFSPLRFLLVLGIIAAVLLAIIIAGRIQSWWDSAVVAERALKLEAKHRQVRGLDTLVDASVDSLTIQIGTFRQQQAYKYAKAALDQIEILLDRADLLRRRRDAARSIRGVPVSRRFAAELKAHEQAFNEAYAKRDVDTAKNHLIDIELIVANALDDHRARPPVPVPAGVGGAVGLWSLVPAAIRPSLAGIGRIEGAATVAAAAALAAAFVPEALRFSGEFSALGGPVFIWAVAVIAFILALAILAVHAAFGVHRGTSAGGPGPDRSAGAVVRATLVASSSLIAVPFVAAAIVMGGWAGLALAFAGAALGIEIHGRLNAYIEWLNGDPAGLRAPTARIGDLLSDRTITEPGRPTRPMDEDELNRRLADGSFDTLAIFGSFDLRVPVAAARLFVRSLKARPGAKPMNVVIAGGVGWATPEKWKRDNVSEAEILDGLFREEVRRLLGPGWTGGNAWEDAIVLDKKSTNSGGNVKLSIEELGKKGIRPESVLIVTNPYLQLRARTTWLKQSNLPNTLVASWAPYQLDPSRLSDEILRSWAEMALREYERAVDYALVKADRPVPFTVPVEISADEHAAGAALKEQLTPRPTEPELVAALQDWVQTPDAVADASMPGADRSRWWKLFLLVVAAAVGVGLMWAMGVGFEAGDGVLALASAGPLGLLGLAMPAPDRGTGEAPASGPTDPRGAAGTDLERLARETAQILNLYERGQEREAARRISALIADRELSLGAAEFNPNRRERDAAAELRLTGALSAGRLAFIDAVFEENFLAGRSEEQAAVAGVRRVVSISSGRTAADVLTDARRSQNRFGAGRSSAVSLVLLLSPAQERLAGELRAAMPEAQVLLQSRLADVRDLEGAVLRDAQGRRLPVAVVAMAGAVVLPEVAAGLASLGESPEYIGWMGLYLARAAAAELILMPLTLTDWGKLIHFRRLVLTQA